jgi:hypothetical protein
MTLFQSSIPAISQSSSIFLAASQPDSQPYSHQASINESMIAGSWKRAKVSIWAAGCPLPLSNTHAKNP